MKHLVVIPTYNEYDNIQKIVREIFSLYEDISILVVDDSSPDNTADIVKSMQSEYKNLYLLIQEKKGGLAKAYINGFKWGINNGFELFTTCDADFSHNPKYIKDAIELINKGFDVASGSRYMKGGGTDEKHWFRNLTSVGGNIYARLILGRKFIDWTEGFNTYTKSALEKINLDSIKVRGFIFSAEMKYKAVKCGLKTAEFPIYFEVRKKGDSKFNADILFEAFFNIIKIKTGL